MWVTFFIFLRHCLYNHFNFLFGCCSESSGIWFGPCPACSSFAATDGMRWDGMGSRRACSRCLLNDDPTNHVSQWLWFLLRSSRCWAADSPTRRHSHNDDDDGEVPAATAPRKMGFSKVLPPGFFYTSIYT